MKEIYLIIKTGCEGIDDLCYCTENKDDAIRKIKFLKAKMLREREKAKERARFEGYPNDKSCNFIYDPDFYCVQKWNGKSFKCVCKECGVSPSKEMLR